ncbi:DUF4097 family beta strand repeat-containing protein [Halobium salinum]|uniref:DUF4097 family beta strand repeat-containing protein n=1 Tax=Halobium salinum TaxID=1364940 RepID=A0ABD5PCT1_9EURY|nr:DUF4097 family beta strand repeat-containing protein [Halobium salinum]
MRRRTLLRSTGLAGAAGLVGLAGCTAPGTSPEETTSTDLDVPDGAAVRVRNTNGSVVVDTHDGDGVVLTVTKRAPTSAGRFDEVTVETGSDSASDGEEGDGAAYLVETVYGTDEARRTVSVGLDLAVPAGTRVAETTTANGRVTVGNTAGDLTVESANGAIEVRNVDGFVTVTAANGSVDVSGVAGVDGIETSNGSIDAEVPAIRRDTTVRTSNGNVDVALGADLDAELLATTELGSIDVDDLALDPGERPARRVEGRLGDGGNRLRIRTGNGGIDLVALEE